MNYFMTGSRALNAESPGSDWDIACLCTYNQLLGEIQDKLIVTSTNEATYNTGIYIGTREKTFNLIPLSPVDYMAWGMTTEVMSKLRPIKNRVQRISMFENLVTSFKIQTRPIGNRVSAFEAELLYLKLGFLGERLKTLEQIMKEIT